MTTLGAQHQAGGKDKKVSSFFTHKKYFFCLLKKVFERKMISSKHKDFSYLYHEMELCEDMLS